jgi:4-hydroxy-3-methylbut-2-enyl diphosphate reductase
LKSLAGAGFFPVIIGKRDHVEVRGMTEDLDEFGVVLEDADLGALPRHSKYGVISQTTQPVEKVRRLVQLMRDRFPNAEVRFVDTVCQPTKQRQSAAADLAQKCDIVIVIGGTHSNNTQELVRTCARFCARVHHIQTALDLCAGWFLSGDVVGLTAGTSTPDTLINEAEQHIKQMNKERHEDRENCVV